MLYQIYNNGRHTWIKGMHNTRAEAERRMRALQRRYPNVLYSCVEVVFSWDS